MYPGYLRFFLTCGGDASGSATCRHVLGHRQSHELLSFRPKVGPLEGVRYDLNRFARWHTPLYKMVNRLLWDVNLGFHMCSHCLSMLIPFSQAWQKNDKYRSGESTWSGRTANGRIDLRANPPDTKATSGEARETTTLDPLTPKTVHKKSLAPGVPKVWPGQSL